MSISRFSIASNLASRFGAVSAPSGYSALRSSSFELPDQIGATPCVLVYPPEETLSYPPSSRHSLQEWRVVYYLARVKDAKRQMTDLYRWADALIPQLDASVSLDLSPEVMLADVTGARTGPTTYAEETFDALELSVVVNAQEAVTFSG